MREAMLWETEDERVHCLLCPHGCRIADGKRGVCGVRGNVGGRLYGLTYGRVASVAADPVEKKPVFHYRPGTRVFSLGSVGCTMSCEHCQNWQISRERPGEGDRMLEHLSPEAAVRLASEHLCEGVAFTYNEPVIWVEYVLDVARLAKADGLYTVMVTNGFITRAGLDEYGPLIDVWRVDVKGFDDETYRRLCRVPSMEPVLEQAVRAKREWGMHVEVVTNVVPTLNDDERTLRGIAGWIARELGPETAWHVTRFFPYLELAHLPPTPIGTLRRAREIGAEEGLEHVYLGNVDEPGGEDTLCSGCGEAAVRRSGFEVLSLEAPEGACARCGRSLGIVT